MLELVDNFEFCITLYTKNIEIIHKKFQEGFYFIYSCEFYFIFLFLHILHVIHVNCITGMLYQHSVGHFRFQQQHNLLLCCIQINRKQFFSHRKSHKLLTKIRISVVISNFSNIYIMKLFIQLQKQNTYIICL